MKDAHEIQSSLHQLSQLPPRLEQSDVQEMTTQSYRAIEAAEAAIRVLEARKQLAQALRETEAEEGKVAQARRARQEMYAREHGIGDLSVPMNRAMLNAIAAHNPLVDRYAIRGVVFHFMCPPISRNAQWSTWKQEVARQLEPHLVSQVVQRAEEMRQIVLADTPSGASRTEGVRVSGGVQPPATRAR